MKKIIILLCVLLFAMVSQAQESYCDSKVNINTQTTKSTTSSPIPFVEGDEIRITFLKAFDTATSIIVSFNGVQVVVLSEGKSVTYTIPLTGDYKYHVESNDLTMVKFDLSCVGGDSLIPPANEDPNSPLYGSSNWQYGAAHIAIIFPTVYDDGDNIQLSLSIYDYATETYYSDFVKLGMVQTLMDTPPFENTPILSFGSIQVHVLTTGELQFTLTDSEGKQYALIMPDLSGEGVYGYVVEPQV